VSPRHVSWLITRNWYDKSRFWKLFFRAHGTVPVGSSAAETIQVACEVLGKGQQLGVFPEGRISHDGKLQRFHSGIARMAAISGAPVIPVGIQGAYESLPRQRVVPRPGPVVISLGEPRVFEGAPWTSPPPKSLLREFRDDLFVEVARLAGQPVDDAPSEDSVEPEENPASARVQAG
jgi:1-acyl-sn-glycerol-3-phosphate acyltransferase